MIKKRLGFILAIGLLAFLVADCASTKGIVRNREQLETIKYLAVLPLDCDRPDVGITIAESLATELVRSRFQIVNRPQLDIILMQQGLSVTDIVESQQYMLGEIKGLDGIIVGSAMVSYGFADVAYGGNVGYVSRAEARIIDSRTGEVLMEVTFTPAAVTTQKASTPKGIINASKAGSWIGREIMEKTK